MNKHNILDFSLMSTVRILNKLIYESYLAMFKNSWILMPLLALSYFFYFYFHPAPIYVLSESWFILTGMWYVGYITAYIKNRWDIVKWSGTILTKISISFFFILWLMLKNGNFYVHTFIIYSHELAIFILLFLILSFIYWQKTILQLIFIIDLEINSQLF